MAKDISLNERIIFALDVSNTDEAKRWVKTLEAHTRFFKVGLQLFLGGGFDIIEWILKRNLRVFMDLKFFDVPETASFAKRLVNPLKFVTSSTICRFLIPYTIT